jgi:hypothetical protein
MDCINVCFKKQGEGQDALESYWPSLVIRFSSCAIGSGKMGFGPPDPQRGKSESPFFPLVLVMR